MPNVVIDTSISLPATLSPTGARRRFWVVLALGALSYEVEHGRLELDALTAQAVQEGGSVGGIDKALLSPGAGKRSPRGVAGAAALRDARGLGRHRLTAAL
jgi:hypothetical protein